MAIEQQTLAHEVAAAPAQDRTRPYRDAVADALKGRRTTLDMALRELTARADDVAAVAARLVATLRSANKVLVAGNGGSAAEAQHFAAELVGRFKHDRAPYAALALTTDTATLTAVANDYGYPDVFARQVLAFGQRGDLLLAFSTSGESENLLRAAAACQARGIGLVAITGARPSRLEAAADLTLRMPAGDAAVIQELHKIITHVLCDLIETELMAWPGEAAR
ncbi:MAG TPA: SIS domain-containing protein [Chloroflexota bacterium]|nr:SIS domain-containing protein [Chloroflexota bacterium]